MPNLISNDIYNETIDIINNKTHLNPIFSKLKLWYCENLDYEIYNFFVQENPYGKKDTFQLMYLANGLLYADKGKIKIGTIHDTGSADGKLLNEVNAKSFAYFADLCLEYQMFTDINWLNESISGYDFNPIWWCDTIEKFARKAIPEIKENYNDCNISLIVNSGFGSITVFFDSDETLKMNKSDGVCNSIESDVSNMLLSSKVHEKLMMHCKGKKIVDFSSKETLERDYSGNLYYFYK